MTTLETEEKKMPESTDLEVKQQEGAPTDDVRYSTDWIAGLPSQEKVVSVEDPYQQKKPRRPVWAELADAETDPGLKAIAERRRFLKELQEGVTRVKVDQEVQRQWKARQEQKQQRQQQRLQEYEQQTPQEVQETPRITSGNRMLTFFGRQFEIASKEVRKNFEQERQFFDRLGKRLRGPAGFLRGVASTFKGIRGISTKIGEGLESKPKQPLSSGVPARKPPGSL